MLTSEQYDQLPCPHCNCVAEIHDGDGPSQAGAYAFCNACLGFSVYTETGVRKARMPDFERLRERNPNGLLWLIGAKLCEIARRRHHAALERHARN